MTSRLMPWTLIAFLFLVVPSIAAAQQLEPGTWTGTVTPPGEATVEATFDVRQTGDTIRITLKVQFGDFPFSNIKLASDRLTFTFEPGTPVDCVLMLRENGSYSGDCTDSNGEVGVIVMVPPADVADAMRTRVPRTGRVPAAGGATWLATAVRAR